MPQGTIWKEGSKWKADRGMETWRALRLRACTLSACCLRNSMLHEQYTQHFRLVWLALHGLSGSCYAWPHSYPTLSHRVTRCYKTAPLWTLKLCGSAFRAPHFSDARPHTCLTLPHRVT